MLNTVTSTLLVAGLVFMGTAPFVADYIVLAAAGAGLVAGIVNRDGLLRSLPALMLALGLGLIALSVPFVYRSEADLLPIFAFAPLLLAPGAAVLIGRHGRWLAPQAFALACLIGAAAACLAGLAEYSASGGMRVGAGNNPIHYAGITVMLGFMALTGACQGGRVSRLLFLIGPLLGLLATLMSGSRGPLLAWLVMAVVGAPFLLRWFLRDRLFVGAFAVAVVAIGAAVLIVNMESRASSGLASFVTAVEAGVAAETGGPDAGRPSDGSTSLRQAMYRTAWQAFSESPVVGQGFGQMMPFARAAFPDLPQLAALENLHSDIGNFATMAGVLGLLAYALFITAPLALLRRAAARRNRQLLLGSILLTVGYGTLGLTNAMFGVLPQTVLFMLILGYLIALRWHKEPVAA